MCVCVSVCLCVCVCVSVCVSVSVCATPSFTPKLSTMFQARTRSQAHITTELDLKSTNPEPQTLPPRRRRQRFLKGLGGTKGNEGNAVYRGFGRCGLGWRTHVRGFGVYIAAGTKQTSN